MKNEEFYTQTVRLANEIAKRETRETHTLPNSDSYIEIDLSEDYLFQVEVVFAEACNCQIVEAKTTQERDDKLGTTSPKQYLHKNPFPVGFSDTYDAKESTKLYIKSKQASVTDAILVTKKYWK